MGKRNNNKKQKKSKLTKIEKNTSEEVPNPQVNDTTEIQPRQDSSSYQNYSYNPLYRYNQCGLNNIGNTCFMNSILQCLNNIPQLIEYYLKLKHNFFQMNNNSMSKVFADLVDNMQQYRVTQPNIFKLVLSRYAPLFQSFGQQDAHECLTAILDALHQESCQQMEDDEERSIITDLFQGQMEYTIKCSEVSQCGNVTYTTDPFLDIPVFIPISKMFQVRLFLMNGDQTISYFPFSSTDTIQSIIDHLQKNIIVMGISSDNTFSVRYQPSTVLSKLNDQSIIFYEINEKNNNNPLIIGLFCTENDESTIPSFKYPPILLKPSTKNYDKKLHGYLSQHFESDRLKYYINDKPMFEISIPMSLSLSYEIKPIVINFNENIFIQFQSKLHLSSKQLKEDEQRKFSIPLRECLRKDLNAIERNSLNTDWYCSQCQQNRQLTKENHILSLPKILIIHLKRFNMESPPPRTKINTFVKYPSVLDMSEFLSNKSNGKQIYDLIGVSVHSGSFEGGHYIAYTKKESSWFVCNDSYINSMVDQEVITKNAYILFYSKRV